ncbi:hypothetical protein FHY29_001935 [Xanthomonas arboricola]|uniref:hypothetical protein n=1 Tax=Xanthomonas arboricola TaxID=56448 RepID=UPI00141A6D2A|nr:hypothetical protein [Xanthomonas arboricola]
MIKITACKDCRGLSPRKRQLRLEKTKGMPGVGWIARLLAIAIAIARAEQIKCAALDK